MDKELIITSWSAIRDNSVFLNDKKEVDEENFANFAAFIKGLYKRKGISYPKFYKMDNLSKLGFLTAELLIQESNVLTSYSQEDIGVVVANSNSSLDTDLVYQDSIKDKSNYFPSPSVFVYTLPNILIGEICIRHKIKGENAFLVSGEFDAGLLYRYVATLFEQEKIKACVCGWVDILSENYNSFLLVVEKKPRDEEKKLEDINQTIFNEININQLYKQTAK